MKMKIHETTERLGKRLSSFFLALLFLVCLSFPVFADDDNGSHNGSVNRFFKSHYTAFHSAPNVNSIDDFVSEFSAPSGYYIEDYSRDPVHFFLDAGYSYDDLGYATFYSFNSSNGTCSFNNVFFLSDQVKALVYDRSTGKVTFDFVSNQAFYVTSSMNFSLSSKSSSGTGRSNEIMTAYSYTSVITIPYSIFHSVVSSVDILDESGEGVYIPPKPAEFIVNYSPDITLNTDMSTSSELVADRIRVNVSLSESSKAYCNDRNIYYSILPYVSTSPVDQGVSSSFDNCVAVSTNNSYYIDQYTIDSNFHSNDGVSPSLGSDVCFGRNICYSLDKSNDYSIQIDFYVSTTAIKSNYTYYFYILASESFSPIGVTGFYPNRYFFKKYLYESFQGLLGEDSFEFSLPNGFLHSYLADYRPFSLSKVRKKESSLNAATSGLYNELCYNPSVLYPGGDSNPITYDELDEYNSALNDEYYESFSSGSLGLDLTSLDSLFNSARSFFDFLKSGFYVLPPSINLMFVGSVGLLIFLRIMGR